MEGLEIKGAQTDNYLERILESISNQKLLKSTTDNGSLTSIPQDPSNSSSQNSNTSTHHFISKSSQDCINPINLSFECSTIFYGKGKHVAKVATLNELLKARGFTTKLEVYNDKDVSCLRATILSGNCN